MKTKYAHFNWKRLNIVLAIIAIFLFAPVTAGALEETLTFEGQDTVAISSFTEGCFTVAKYGGILNPVIAERGVEGNQCIENSTPGCQTLIITATEGGDFSLKHFDLAIFNCTLVVGYPCPTNVYIRGYDGEDKVFGFATANGDDEAFEPIDPGVSLIPIDKLHIVLGGGYTDSMEVEAVDNIVLELIDDLDGDCYSSPVDCEDNDATINPGATELPGNFLDENCDGNLGSCDPCIDWKNHGQFVRCVAQDADALVEMGILTEEEGDALVTSAAQSKVGKKGFVPEQCPEPEPE